MKIALVTPWDNAWVPYYKQAIEKRGHEFILTKPGKSVTADLILHGWTGQSQAVAGVRNVMFLRRYELFDGGLGKVNWNRVQALICVNTWIAGVVRDAFVKGGVETPVHMIYNGTDSARWSFKERAPTNKIGMACHIHPKKNLPLAMQVMAHLPKDYELHIAGDIQDPCTAEYLNHLSRVMGRDVYLYGHVEDMDGWWEDKSICLSTSLSEGNPNNVIEAMAKGIKPVVHCWPGAEDQFPVLFKTAEEAAQQIQSSAYDSMAYRTIVGKKFSLDNIERVLDLAI